MIVSGDRRRKAPRPGMRGRIGEACHRAGVLRFAQRARAALRKDLRILAYHRVLTIDNPDGFDFDLDLISTSVDEFRQQMLYIKRNYRPIRLDQAVEALETGTPLPSDAVAVTFDDGYDDNYRHAFPILREVGVPATFFVSTGHIDSGAPYAYDWLVHMILCTGAPTLELPELGIDTRIPADRQARRQLAQQALARIKTLDAATQTAVIDRLGQAWGMPAAKGHADCRPMNWAQLREMVAGGCEVGSHGVHHRMLAKLQPPEYAMELRQSKDSIERELATPVSSVAYPVGGATAFDRGVISATVDAGYRIGCSYIRGTNPAGRTDRFALRRLPVEREMGIGWFAAMLALPELISYPDVGPRA